MKYLVVTLVIVFGLWLWRRGQASSAKKRNDDAVHAPSTKTVLPMVQCCVCGVHLPHADAVFKGRDAFCGDAHRNQGTP
jgi:uncharacterized protein